MPRTSNCPLFPARDVDLVFRGQSTPILMIGTRNTQAVGHEGQHYSGSICAQLPYSWRIIGR